jgi:hypothetical protein
MASNTGLVCTSNPAAGCQTAWQLKQLWSAVRAALLLVRPVLGASVAGAGKTLRGAVQKISPLHYREKLSPPKSPRAS